MGIVAPHHSDPLLHKTIMELRAQGQVVVVDCLGDKKLRTELNCDRELVMRDGAWHVVKIKS